MRTTETIEQQIAVLTPQTIFDEALVEAICGIEDEIERTVLESKYIQKAAEFKAALQAKKLIKSVNTAIRQLESEYTRANRKQTVQLAYDSNGKPATTIENFLAVLEGDPHFSGLKFNLLTYSPEKMIDGKAERWTDADDAETRRYIETKYHFHHTAKCDDALRILFHRREYHPIRDLIDSLEWDGESRIYNFLHRWTKCEDTAYTREVSRLIFAGGIHRLYNSGCKFDDMPVLIGTKQGEGKSTLVRWLAMNDDYFGEIAEIEGQKGVEALEGVWICEMGELLALTKAREVEAVKAYLTRQNDRYRRPFDKRVTDYKRQCVFIGTTNKEQFLTDKTGNRRFYPVKVNQSGYDLFDHKAEIQAYIKQCWAEAKHLFDKGEIQPFADRRLVEEIRERQAAAVEDDYRVGMITEYLENHTEVCVPQLWQEALHNEYSKPTRKESNELTLIMQSVTSFERMEIPKRFETYGLQRYWRKKKEIPPLPDDDFPEF